VSRASEYQGAVEAGRNELASTRKEGTVYEEGGTQDGAVTEAQTAEMMQDSVGRRYDLLQGEDGVGAGGKEERRLDEGQPRDVAAAKLQVRGCLSDLYIVQNQCWAEMQIATAF